MATTMTEPTRARREAARLLLDLLDRGVGVHFAPRRRAVILAPRALITAGEAKRLWGLRQEVLDLVRPLVRQGGQR